MEKIPSEVHGIVDYLGIGMLLALPRRLRWPRNISNIMTGVALGTAVAGMLTRYELGVFKVIPFKAHLAMDAAKGAAFLAAPLLLDEDDPNVTTALFGLGVFELAMVGLTNPEPYQDDWANRLT